MQSPVPLDAPLADFARDHQPAYVPATNRVLAGFLTAGVYALVLVVGSHRSPAPNRPAPSELPARMEAPQKAHQEAFQTPPEMAREQNRQALPSNMPQETRRNPAQTAPRQQNASQRPSLLERLFGPRDQAAAPVPGTAPSPGPGRQTSSAAKPSSGAPAEQLASAQSAPAEQSASAQSTAKSSSLSPATPGQQGAANQSKDKPPPACQDAAWARAVSNHVRRFFPARQQQAAGVATAHLVIRRSGWLNELEIARTSGNATLDAAAYALLRKAQPLPRIPGRIAADRIDLQLPVAFGIAGDFKITVTGCGG
jgi:periplasmic protein TonB